jgi:hypothetical protein
LKNLKEHFSSFDDTQSLQIKLNKIEETFRNPNLLIQSIKEMQQKQEESLNEIQLKINQMNQVKGNLKTTNAFQPSLSSLNQEDTSLFGSIKLGLFSINTNSFKSQILTNQQHCLELIKVFEFSPNEKWTLLYRVTRDGFSSGDFHSKCDLHSNTLTILNAKQSSFIFGGFASVSWSKRNSIKRPK